VARAVLLAFFRPIFPACRAKQISLSSRPTQLSS